MHSIALFKTKALRFASFGSEKLIVTRRTYINADHRRAVPNRLGIPHCEDRTVFR